jgi:ribosomal protein L11 methyltransferase
MVDYIELNFIITPNSEINREILTAYLSGIEFESFMDTEVGLKAYIQESQFDDKIFTRVLLENDINNVVYFSNKIKAENWNAIWESNFDPVIIDNDCIIRAPFHENLPHATYEIIIEPKMSFGTGHHETTYLMVKALLKITIEKKQVLDMGCGTGILSILASQRGADQVIAIDNDEWAYVNTLENIERNNRKNIQVIQGDAGSIPNYKFYIFLANINRNILVRDIQIYSRYISHGGFMLLSGIYESDMEIIKEEASKNSFDFIEYGMKNNWVSMKFMKV